MKNDSYGKIYKLKHEQGFMFKNLEYFSVYDI